MTDSDHVEEDEASAVGGNSEKSAEEIAIAAAISDAEEITDPLEGIVERAEKNPGAAFEPDVLEALGKLKEEDRAAFEALRIQLKKVGCRVTALDEAITSTGGEPEREPTPVEILLTIAETAELFHCPDGIAYADLDIDGHRETWRVASKGFVRWLVRIYHEMTDSAPSSEALKSSLNVIEAKAHYQAPERPVYMRMGGVDDILYLDLCDVEWQAVEITASGWRIVQEPEVRFRRASGMHQIGPPLRGGSITTLRTFLNVRSESDFVLIVAWVLGVLRNRGPYPILVISGEQGSAKSTFSAILRSLVDPIAAPLRTLPREDRDLFIAANNAHLLAFDNISGLPAWVSDSLCRIATGGGYATRQLFTDLDEIMFDVARPVILNGIEDMVTRPDLADRAIFLHLKAIPEEDRRPEAELWKAFEEARPHILGVLMDAVARGLEKLADTKLEKHPRMADFALWASACETALWPQGTFWSAYCDNRDKAVDNVIDAEPVANAVRSLMTDQSEWTGTATKLLQELTELAGDYTTKAKNWPKSPQALTGRLRRGETFMRKIGVNFDYSRKGHKGARVIVISKDAQSHTKDTVVGDTSQSHGATNSSNTERLIHAPGGKPLSKMSPFADDADDKLFSIVSDKLLNSLQSDDADDSDDDFPSLRTSEKKEVKGWSTTL